MSDREFLPIPPAESATDPVHSPADMRQRWRALMGQLGFGDRVLWIGFVGADRRMVKVLIDLPLGNTPRRGDIENLMSALPEILTEVAPGGTVALLLTRPGRGPVSNLDRSWARLLAAAAEDHAVPLEPIFRAHDESLVEVSRGLKLAG